MPRCQVLAPLLVAAVSAGDVATLSTGNFSETVQEKDLWLVKFYAPWCGHCKRLAPILDEVAAEAEGEISFGKVDCTIDEALCKQYDVKGFPTLVFMQGAMRWVYKGPRKKPELIAMSSRMQLPAIHQLQSESSLDKAMKGTVGTPVVFLLGQPAAGDESDADAAAKISAFDAAANQRKHTDVFISSDRPNVLRQVMGSADLPPVPFVARIEKGEEPRLLADSSTAAAIEAWVEEQRVPSFSLVDDANFGMLMNAGRPLALLLLDPKATGSGTTPLSLDASFSGVGGELRALSRNPTLRAQFVFAMLDGADFADYLHTTYAIESSSLPRLIVLWKSEYFSSLRTFYLDAPGTASSAEGMRDFLERVASGAVVGEFEGRAGAPARWWRSLTAMAPPLHALDFLPRGTFVVPPVLFVLYVVFKLIMTVPDEDVYDRDAAELRAMKRAKATAKEDKND